MRTLLLLTFFSSLFISASAQSWSVSARTGAHLSAASVPMLFLRGSGMVTEVGVWHRIGNSHLAVGMTIGNFQLAGLTRFSHWNSFAGCTVGATFTALPSLADRPLFSSSHIARESYWTALPALRYTWLDRKVYSQITVAAGGVYQSAFSRTRVDPTAAPGEVPDTELSERDATLSPSWRTEFTLGLRLGDRWRIGIYGGYDRTRLRVRRFSRDIGSGSQLTVAGDLPLQQLRAGITAEVAL